MKIDIAKAKAVDVMLTPVPSIDLPNVKPTQGFDPKKVQFENDISLDNLELPDVDWVVNGLISQDGLTVLAGKQKSGKSFGLMQMAQCIASGIPFINRRTKQGDVLYLALEDGLRRLKFRKRKIREALNVNDISGNNYSLDKVRIRRMDEGGFDTIKHWVENVAVEPRLIIIDTWSRFAPKQNGSGTGYDKEVRQIAPLQEYCQQKNVAIILVTHCNQKDLTDDWTESIQGTSAIVGTADQIILYRKTRGKSNDAELLTDGKDGEPIEEAFKFEDLIWTTMGDKETYAKTKARQEILDTANVLERDNLFTDKPISWKPYELMKEMFALPDGMKPDKADSQRIYQTCKRMVEDRELEKTNGFYHLPVLSCTYERPEGYPIVKRRKVEADDGSSK